MHMIRRAIVPTIGLLALAMMVWGGAISPLEQAEAAGLKKSPQHHESLRPVPANMPNTSTRPLTRPINAPQLVTIPNANTSKPATVNPQTNGAAPQASPTVAPVPPKPINCPQPEVDMKVLVIAATSTEPELQSIKQALEYLGTPYTVYVASQTPGGLTPNKLANGCHGYYQGTVLSTGDLGYQNGGNWVSALSQQEWVNLWSYEASMKIRELSWYTFPSATFGYQAPNGEVDTTTTPLAAHLTSAGHTQFSYLQNNATINLRYAYTYKAKPLDASTTVLLNDTAGNALAAVRQYTDGRQALSLTFDSNPELAHTILLSYGLVNWLTKGLFLGERHVYMSPQVDDVFIDASEWLPTIACGTSVDNDIATYRINATDWNQSLAWQRTLRNNPMTKNVTLTIAFNGFGTVAGSYTPDTLTPAAKATQNQVYWVSHTYDHENLDNITYDNAKNEIVQNNQIAANLGLSQFKNTNMVTPDVSGLTNPNYLKAAYDNGLRYLVSDTSHVGYTNPSPNAGIYNSIQPAILMIPRRPTNIFFNVSTPEELAAEYNCLYRSYWGRDLTPTEVMEKEADLLATYMLKGDLDPWMFHQTNMRAYDGKNTLLDQTLQMTIQKYSQFYNLPIASPTMDKLGQTVAERTAYVSAGVTATVKPGISITLKAQKAARVPVTGLKSNGAEQYGGQSITYVNLQAGQSITLPWIA